MAIIKEAGLSHKGLEPITTGKANTINAASKWGLQPHFREAGPESSLLLASERKGAANLWGRDPLWSIGSLHGTISSISES
jgi:hypothetical protein